jgi:hypothetical protein
MTKEQIAGLLDKQKIGLSGYYNNNYKVEYQGIPYIFRIPIHNAASMDMRFIDEEIMLNFLAQYKEIAVPGVELNEVYDGQNIFFIVLLRVTQLKIYIPRAVLCLIG